jgi:hypothetical protein
MPIEYTSRVGLRAVQAGLSGRRLEVFTAIAAWDVSKHGLGPSIEDLARLLARKECSICARLNELRDAGAIRNGPLKINPLSRKPAMTYVALEYREPTYAFDRNGQMDFTGAMMGG